ncbi:hypothetical protein HU200_063148 [Digitaria exilis]|uniref:Uncharacterized protein n=1 Tax=Digitaria exilis TaxID=1010633 RepID=A0A835A7G3_9POAL|nr:hypothetical protein HU200_063148 [Digitaria exilis]
MVKYNYLYRELLLRYEARKITGIFFLLKEKGMFNWEAYKEHRESIKNSFDILRNALARYKDRRIKAGYFYMCNHQRLHAVYVMSPLYTMPRKEALKKIRRILRMRQAYSHTSKKITLDTRVKFRNVY